MQKIHWIFFLVLWLPIFTVAQTGLPATGGVNYTSKGIVFNKELAFDFRLHTGGFAFAVNTGKIITYYKTKYYHFEFGDVRHQKEYKNQFRGSTRGTSPRSFVFGKQNNLFVLRTGVGFKRYFSEKARRKGLAVGINYEIGPSLALLKPYYIHVSIPDQGIVERKYSDDIAEYFLDINRISGASQFSKGIGETSVVPGGNAKLAVHFDWGAFDEYIKALEVGIMADFYYKKIPIMVENSAEGVKNRPFFINLYVSLQLGKRW